MKKRGIECVRKGQGRGEYTTHTSSSPLGPWEIIFGTFLTVASNKNNHIYIVLNESGKRMRERERV